jgi:C1A family cysteine protease
MFSLLSSFILFTVLGLSSANQNLCQCQCTDDFVLFKEQYNKVYTNSKEELYRRIVFNNNYNRIQEHNRNEENSFQLEMNQFGDLLSHEYHNKNTYYHLREQPRVSRSAFVETDVVDTIDWRSQNAVTPVKNQGQCGSCWAFSTTGSLEGLNAIKTGKLVSFSEQQLMDCSKPEGDQSCNGGLMDYAFQYVIDSKGICTEEEYSYEGKDEDTCKVCDRVMTITGFTDVAENNEIALKQAVAQLPVSVAIQADQFEFQFYKSGIFTGNCGNPSSYQLDHGVLAVGYGTDNGQDYWIVKNSWGATWGDKGYIRLARNVEEKQGKCGIAMQPSFPVSE